MSGAVDAEHACGRLTIDLGAIVANWRTLAAAAAPAACAAVVKGDAYGMGLEAVVDALAAAGCRTFFTALVEEGVRARRAAPDADIYVLNGFPPGAGPALVAERVRPVLGSPEEVEEWTAFGRAHGPQPAALHVDTGMNRLGLTLAQARDLAGHAELLAGLDLTLLISHLACADEPGHAMNARQREAFAAARALFPGVPASLANSAATLALPGLGDDLARPGIGLYGGRSLAAGENTLRPVATLEGRIIKVREAQAGDSVGYGALEHVKRASRLAVVGIGYADGYPRSAGSSDKRPGAAGFIAGQRVPLVGRVSMDLLVFDVTDVPANHARRGQWIELFGPNMPVDEVAAHAGTIGYELLTQLGSRFARHYIPAVP